MLQNLRGQFQTRRLPGQLARFASGRAEDSFLFHKNVAQRATFLWKRKKEYHAAAGDSAVYRVKHPV
jgi:hypothetical protein